ncbi:hypothetical protein PHEL49_1756 [Polaribacter sp. Hel1_33_49]|nr:hypothetical protein PHEL49_1756 [Polaribacter sp. Hel1_33_49]
MNPFFSKILLLFLIEKENKNTDIIEQRNNLLLVIFLN